MNFESISTPEKEKGIEFDDNGNTEVELDGEIVKTSEDDFGTIKQEPDAIIEKASA